MMSRNSPEKPAKPAGPAQRGPAGDRERRLADALRANLKRRKAAGQAEKPPKPGNSEPEGS